MDAVTMFWSVDYFVECFRERPDNPYPLFAGVVEAFIDPATGSLSDAECLACIRNAVAALKLVQAEMRSTT